MRLRGKVAIVTGAARGIGRAIAARYAEEGATPVVADLDAGRAEATAGEIGGGAFAVGFDVTRGDDIDRLIRTVVERAGRIDILVNNAGVFDMGPLVDFTPERWDRLFAVNTRGLFFMLQATARQMIAQGRGGKVVNLASQAGRHGIGRVLAYCATKAAVISITQSAALELIPHRINVNAISPGVVDTDLWVLVDRLWAEATGQAIGEQKRKVGEAVPFGRMGVPEDLTGAAVFLASADADYVVGQTLNVDGGNRLN